MVPPSSSEANGEEGVGGHRGVDFIPCEEKEMPLHEANEETMTVHSFKIPCQSTRIEEEETVPSF